MKYLKFISIILILLLFSLPFSYALSDLEKYRNVKRHVPEVKREASDLIIEAQNSKEYNETLLSRANQFSNNANSYCIRAENEEAELDYSRAYDLITICYFNYYQSKYTAKLSKIEFYHSKIKQKISEFKPHWHIPTEIIKFNASENNYNEVFNQFEWKIERGYPDNATYILEQVSDFRGYDNKLDTLMTNYPTWNSRLENVIYGNLERDKLVQTMVRIWNFIILFMILGVGTIIGQEAEKRGKTNKRK